MKTVLILCFAFGIVAALDDPLISLESKVEHDGKYHYHYETGAGSKVTQDGYLKNVDPQHDGESIQGQFSYVSDDGNEYAVSYTADENGYQAQGAHIPTPPPIPAAIQRSLEYIASHPAYVDPKQKLPVVG